MKLASRLARALFLVTAVTALAIACFSKQPQDLRRAIHAELQPVALTNCTLERFGSAHDGGYLMCGNLPGAIDAAYSYGVGKNDDWGCDVSRRYGVPVHQYDCFNPARPTCDGGTFVFHNECVGDTREQDAESRAFDTLQNQMARNGHAGGGVIVKMDIEGAEWDALLATPDSVLASIPQLAMELHGYDDPKILEVLRRLKQHFHLVNLNYNNWSCRPDAAPIKAWAYQVLFVNKRLSEVDPSVPVPAPTSPLNALDAPNLPPCP
jgi:hypothetical protein